MLKECFLAKLQALNLHLCQKINSTTGIFQLICLPFENSCLSKKTSKERVRILKSNVHYVTQYVLLFIFSCCSWYVWLIYDQYFTKQGWITWMDSTCFQVRSVKKKGKHGKYSVEVHNGKYSTQYMKYTWNMKYIIYECGNYMLMPK